jgi:hypothetical protein
LKGKRRTVCTKGFGTVHAVNADHQPEVVLWPASTPARARSIPYDDGSCGFEAKLLRSLNLKFF